MSLFFSFEIDILIKDFMAWTMSDTGGTSDTLDGQAVSDTGESSVYSDWSVVDEHGDLAVCMNRFFS